MNALGNLIWLACGGAISGLLWCLAGAIWSITIIGIPIGKQCFKVARLCFCPFGRSVVYNNGTGSFVLNILWIALTGWVLAVEATIVGVFYCATIVGIPFGKQCFKIARLALSPFGATIS